MVLKILYAVGSYILPTEYFTHALVAVIGVVTVYAFAQGRHTTRERDLHGRTILITAAYHLDVFVTPAG
jgi:predicted nuclease with RNAse H fold